MSGESAGPMALRGGFWSRGTIEDQQRLSQESGDPLIWPYSPNRLEPASYRLRIGEEIYISPSSPSEPQSKRLLLDRQSAVIPAGQFAFLTTEEIVRIPLNALAFITLRSKAAKFRGLINVSGFHVDPGYSGKLIFSVFNAGPGPVHLARGDEWFEIFFAELDATTSITKEKTSYQGIPSELINPIAGEFNTFKGLDAKIGQAKQELDARIQRIEREHSVIRWSAALIVGVLITLGVRECSLSPAANPLPSSSTSTGAPTNAP